LANVIKGTCCRGLLVEIGMAYSLGKPIILIIPEGEDHNL